MSSPSKPKPTVGVNDEALLRAVLEQVDVGSSKVPIDYGELALTLDVSKGAASKRWSRYKAKITSPEGASSDGNAEDAKLLLAVFDLLDITSSEGKGKGRFRIDYGMLATDLGAPSKGAAAKRWSRFLTKLKLQQEEATGGVGNRGGQKELDKQPETPRGRKSKRAVYDDDDVERNSPKTPQTFMSAPKSPPIVYMSGKRVRSPVVPMSVKRSRYISPVQSEDEDDNEDEHDDADE